MALPRLGSLFLHTVVVVVAEDTPASVAFRVEGRMASMTAVEYSRMAMSGIVAAAAMAAPEAAVAVDAAVGAVPAVGTAELDAGYGIVAFPGYPGSIRQKPS
jgi:hypothetical protein